MLKEKFLNRVICTCYYGRLCETTHKTWEEYRQDTELIDYCSNCKTSI